MYFTDPPPCCYQGLYIWATYPYLTWQNLCSTFIYKALPFFISPSPSLTHTLFSLSISLFSFFLSLPLFSMYFPVQSPTPLSLWLYPSLRPSILLSFRPSILLSFRSPPTALLWPPPSLCRHSSVSSFHPGSHHSSLLFLRSPSHHAVCPVHYTTHTHTHTHTPPIQIHTNTLTKMYLTVWCWECTHLLQTHEAESLTVQCNSIRSFTLKSAVCF